MAKVTLSELGELLDIQTRASQTKLKSLNIRETKLLDMLMNLSDTREQVAKQSDRKVTTTRDFQNDLQHLRWVDQRRAAINIELAQVKALISVSKHEVSHHFARQQATTKLAKKQMTAKARVNERRTRYGS